jgi:hypothetical protein
MKERRKCRRRDGGKKKKTHSSQHTTYLGPEVEVEGFLKAQLARENGCSQ